MSNCYCWQCDKDYPKDELLEIPVFHKGRIIRWCLNCVKKQLKYTDYVLMKKEKVKATAEALRKKSGKWERLIKY